MKIKKASYGKRTKECPDCGLVCKRHSIGTRTVFELHDVVLRIKYAKYYCKECEKHFSEPVPGVERKSKFSARVIDKALEIKKNRKLSYEELSFVMLTEYKVSVSAATMHSILKDRDAKGDFMETRFMRKL